MTTSLIIILAAFIPFSTFASQTGDASQPAWAGKEFRKCEQGCTYKKGTENYSVRALYLMNRIDALDKDRSKVHEELKDFCINGESTGKCLERYKIISLQELQEAKAAIMKNNAMAEALKNDKSNFIADKTEEGKAQVPVIHTLEELDKQYQEDRRGLRELIKPQYQEMVNAHAPAPEDYVLINRETGLLEKTCSNGDCKCTESFCYDLKKFKAAQAEYEQDKKRLMTPDIEKLGNKDLTNPPKKLDDKSIGSKTADAYHETHDLAVEAANKAMGQHEIKFDKKASEKPDPLRGKLKVKQPTAGKGDNIYVGMQAKTIDDAIKQIRSSLGRQP